MTPIAFVLNGTLILLLLFALYVGLKLERRLRGLRDSQAHFAKAATELNAAIARAEAGLGEIRKTMAQAEETLTERVDEARAAAKKLEAAMSKAANIQIEVQAPVREPARPAPAASAAPLAPAPALRARAEDDTAALPIKDLLARLRGSLPLEDAAPARTPARPIREADPVAQRSRARVDDDLFEAAEAFPTLRRAGAA